jgi:cation diffusion facilitator family transporter
VGARYWYRPADESHPYGHRRIETLVTTILGGSLVVVAAGIGYQAISTYAEPDAGPPGWIAFAAAALAIVTKEMIYRATIAVGKRIKSSALSANAWHHRSDALSSIPAAAAVAAAALDPSLAFLDHVGALVVAVFILQAAWKIMTPALRQLVDAGAPKEDRESIMKIALDTEGVELVHAVRTRYVGSGLQVDLHVKVDPEMSVRDGHRIAEEVTKRLTAEGPDVLDVVVHTEPYEPGDDASDSD